MSDFGNGRLGTLASFCQSDAGLASVRISLFWAYGIAMIPIVLMLVVQSYEPRNTWQILGYDISVDTVIGSVLAFVAAVAVAFLINYLNRPTPIPKRLFKTQFVSSPIDINEGNWGEPLILSLGKHSLILCAETAITCDLDRIGIRPQKISPKHDNFDLTERHDPPIAIESIEDVTPPMKGLGVVDTDGACGVWIWYLDSHRIPPGYKQHYRITIDARRSWKGHIDFRWESPDGRRLEHHKCEIR